jgi:hypothetical protein
MLDTGEGKHTLSHDPDRRKRSHFEVNRHIPVAFQQVLWDIHVGNQKVPDNA